MIFVHGEIFIIPHLLGHGASLLLGFFFGFIRRTTPI
jgi:hypothetical protein